VESSKRGYYRVLRGQLSAVIILELLFLDFPFGALLDAHVLEFARLEHFAALKAFHELCVFIAAHNLHARMLARRLAGGLRVRERL
jgi:hypothetical protein